MTACLQTFAKITLLFSTRVYLEDSFETQGNLALKETANQAAIWNAVLSKEIQTRDSWAERVLFPSV